MLLPLALLNILATSAFAKDANFITPADLPATVSRSYGNMGRGKMPDFPEGYGIEEALESKIPEEICMGKVGQQLSDWKTEREQGFYWQYSISAQFACLPPVTTTTLSGQAAASLYERLKGLKEEKAENGPQKAAEVVCYDTLEDICEGQRLISYRQHDICELADLNAPGTLISLEDVENHRDNRQEQDQGARMLGKALPVYRDGRRDDSPSGRNCTPHQFGLLKGFSRKAAVVRCRLGADPSCRVDGMILE